MNYKTPPRPAAKKDNWRGQKLADNRMPKELNKGPGKKPSRKDIMD